MVEGPIEKLRQNFLRDWETSVLPLENDMRAKESGAIAFAQAALKAAFLLNDGGLVVFPAFGTLFHINWLADDVRVSALGFVVGLTLTWLATAAAYFTMVYQYQSTVANRESIARSLWQSYYPDAQISPSQKTPSEWGNYRRRYYIVSECFRWTGIGFSLFSFGAFLYGAYYGWLSISLHAFIVLST